MAHAFFVSVIIHIGKTMSKKVIVTDEVILKEFKKFLDYSVCNDVNDLKERLTRLYMDFNDAVCCQNEHGFIIDYSDNFSLLRSLYDLANDMAKQGE